MELHPANSVNSVENSAANLPEKSGLSDANRTLRHDEAYYECLIRSRTE